MWALFLIQCQSMCQSIGTSKWEQTGRQADSHPWQSVFQAGRPTDWINFFQAKREAPRAQPICSISANRLSWLTHTKEIHAAETTSELLASERITRNAENADTRVWMYATNNNNSTTQNSSRDTDCSEGRAYRPTEHIFRNFSERIMYMLSARRKCVRASERERKYAHRTSTPSSRRANATATYKQKQQTEAAAVHLARRAIACCIMFCVCVYVCVRSILWALAFACRVKPTKTHNRSLMLWALYTEIYTLYMATLRLTLLVYPLGLIPCTSKGSIMFNTLLL